MTSPCLHAEFRSRADGVGAVRELLAAGVPSSAVEMYSRQPVEEHPPLLPRRSRMSLVAVLAALGAGTGVTALMAWIQRDYPLVTGGMPVSPGWATAVVTFEVTMAGAIFGTVVAMIVESGLLGSRRRAPAIPLPDEGIVVQVDCGDRDDELEALLAAAGAARVERADP